MRGCHLSKWYLDCVADDGSAFIGYWARLHWRALRIDYAATLVARVDAEPRQQHTLSAPPPPRVAPGLCTWRCPELRISGAWTPAAPPFRRRLLETPHGAIRWHCEQPRAVAHIALGTGDEQIEFRGYGYVERLELTIPPWRLPFNTLHWGRFLSAGHALVWLAWQHTTQLHVGPSRRIAVLDGTSFRPAVTADGVSIPGRAVLHVERARPLREGPLVEKVFTAVPRLVRLLPARFRRAHEAKWLSAARLCLADRSASTGWAIHEVVQW